jgi:hypothetical protein
MSWPTFQDFFLLLESLKDLRPTEKVFIKTGITTFLLQDRKRIRSFVEEFYSLLAFMPRDVNNVSSLIREFL